MTGSPWTPSPPRRRPARRRSTAAGTARQALVVDALCLAEGADAGPRHRHPARGPDRPLLRHRAASATSAALAVLAAVVTAMARDEEFAEVYRRDFIGSQDRGVARDLRPGPRARRDRRRRRPRPARARPRRASSCTASSSSARSLTPELHRPHHRPDHPSGRNLSAICRQPLTRPPTTPHTHSRNPMTDIAAAAPEVTPAEHKRLRWALVLISLAQLMVVLDSTIANIALPYIGADLDIAQANLQWIVTGYALAFGGLLLLGGRLGDLYGRRAVFMAGVMIFAVASLIGGLAQNEAMLLGVASLPGPRRRARLPRRAGADHHHVPRRQGAQPRLRRLRRDVRRRCRRRPDPRRLAHRPPRPEPLGMHVDGWRLTFLIVVPIGLVAAAFAPRFFDESERHAGELDIPGAITGTARPARARLRLLAAPARRRTAGATPAPSPRLAVGVALLALFAVIESRVEHPLLPFRIFANQTARRVVRGDDADAGRDVLDVLLPRASTSRSSWATPRSSGRRVPAVLDRHRHLGHRSCPT